MTSAPTLTTGLSRYVECCRKKHGVPGLSVAIFRDNKLYRAASGVLNIETVVEATVDSIFQIGSISKLFTASLIMLLADRGELTLDDPVRHHLPDFHVADPYATRSITVRHLLSHTSGLISDASFSDAWDEETDSIARYVERCFLLPQVHQGLGKRFSYSNAAYVIAGRLVEVVTGTPWRKAIEEMIFKPLRMTHSVASPTGVLRFRAAIGHILSPAVSGQTTTIVSSAYLPLAMSPTGAVLTMSATDLLKFARAHLAGGKTESGERWMSEASVNAMQEVQISLPAPCMLYENSWCPGWAKTEFTGLSAFGHSGGTVGQQALLAFFPERDCACAIQLNGMVFGGAPLLREVLLDFCQELGATRLEPQKIEVPSVDLSPFIGRFGETGWRYEVVAEATTLAVRLEAEGSSALPIQTFTLRPIGSDRFTAFAADGKEMDQVTFLEPDNDGVPRYLFANYRLHRRLAD